MHIRKYIHLNRVFRSNNRFDEIGGLWEEEVMYLLGKLKKEDTTGNNS